MISDPYYRTFEGLKVLISKEWLFYGHNFARRSGLIRTFDDIDDQTGSPIFFIFLDCTYQLMRMNPHSFEFEHSLLSQIAFSMFSNKYAELIGPIAAPA